MKGKSYNSSEEKYSKVIEILKSLPREKAPDNFEFKLFTKIENRNFSLNGKEVKDFPVPSWVFAPVAALVLSAVLFFVVVDVGNFSFQQPLNSEQSVAVVKSSVAKGSQKIKAVLVPNPHYRVVVNQNDVVIKEKMPIPINPRKNVALDQYIAGGKSTRNSNSLNRLVSDETSFFRFDGFMPIERDFRTLEKLRARIDSIQKMLGENNLNSLK